MIETEIIYNDSTERVKAYKDFDKETRTVTFYLDDKKMFPIDKDEDGFTEYIPTPYELFGIECGDGWKGLIEPIMEYINNYNKDKKEEDKIIIFQIKEKFGGLRFYVDHGNEELHNMIDKAEEESYHVCEYCGSKEDVGQTANGWITTLCHNCVKKITQEKEVPIRWRRNNDGKLYIVSYDKDDELVENNKTGK